MFKNQSREDVVTCSSMLFHTAVVDVLCWTMQAELLSF